MVGLVGWLVGWLVEIFRELKWVIFGEELIALHPRKLTWTPKMMVSNRSLLFQASIFRCHVSFPGCKGKKHMEKLPNSETKTSRPKPLEMGDCHLVSCYLFMGELLAAGRHLVFF